MAAASVRQVGIATGIAGLGAIFQARLEDKASSLLSGVRGVDPATAGHQFATGATSDAIRSAPAGSRGQVAQAAQQAFVSGFNEILLIAAAIALAGAVLSFVLVRQRDLVTYGQPARAPADQSDMAQAAA